MTFPRPSTRKWSPRCPRPHLRLPRRRRRRQAGRGVQVRGRSNEEEPRAQLSARSGGTRRMARAREKRECIKEERERYVRRRAARE